MANKKTVSRAFFFVAGLFFLLGTAKLAGAAKKALLIGIDDYQIVRDIIGCRNDVQSMETLLSTSLGYRTADIRKLLDSQASKNRILSLIQEHLVDGVTPKDEVVFFFSGHGTQVRDENGDEDDRMDEALVPWDTRVQGGVPQNLLLDDELGAALAASAASRVLVIVDSCHSGTITKGGLSSKEACQSEQTLRLQRLGSRYLDLFCEQGSPPPANRSLSRDLTYVAEDLGASVVMVSAAQPSELAMPIQIDGGPHGAFTYFFTRGVAGEADKNGDGQVSFAEVKQFVDREVEKKDRFDEIDQKVYTGVSNLDAPVFPRSTPTAWEGVDQGAGAFAVKLQPSGRILKAGTPLTFQVTTEKEGYLILLERSPAGRLRVLVPNAYQEEVGPIHLRPGTTRIPGEMAFWTLETSGPSGKWEYKAIVSRKKMTHAQLVAVDEGFLRAEGSAVPTLLRGVRDLVIDAGQPVGGVQSSKAPPKYGVGAAAVDIR